MSWTYAETTVMGRPVFRMTNPGTGEIREFPSFSALVDGRDEDSILLGRIARALGPDVAKRWEDGEESLDLAAEVQALRESADAVIPREEATSVQRGPGPWRWPRLVEIMVSDSWDTCPVPGIQAANGGPLDMEFALNFLASLYRAGFAVTRPRS